MANEVKGTSVQVYKIPKKGQEARNTANNPDVNPHIRAILLSSNHSPDVLKDGEEASGCRHCLEPHSS